MVKKIGLHPRISKTAPSSTFQSAPKPIWTLKTVDLKAPGYCRCVGAAREADRQVLSATGKFRARTDHLCRVENHRLLHRHVESTSASMLRVKHHGSLWVAHGKSMCRVGVSQCRASGRGGCGCRRLRRNLSLIEHCTDALSQHVSGWKQGFTAEVQRLCCSVLFLCVIARCDQEV